MTLLKKKSFKSENAQIRRQNQAEIRAGSSQAQESALAELTLSLEPALSRAIEVKSLKVY